MSENFAEKAINFRKYIDNANFFVYNHKVRTLSFYG
nr:MAG TPA: hypothetical protein [Caudoviricetes sp.]